MALNRPYRLQLLLRSFVTQSVPCMKICPVRHTCSTPPPTPPTRTCGPATPYQRIARRANELGCVETLLGSIRTGRWASPVSTTSARKKVGNQPNANLGVGQSILPRSTAPHKRRPPVVEPRFPPVVIALLRRDVSVAGCLIPSVWSALKCF
jgi:hypothetical protein